MISFNVERRDQEKIELTKLKEEWKHVSRGLYLTARS